MDEAVQYRNVAKDVMNKDVPVGLKAGGFSMFPTFLPRFVHYVGKCEPSKLRRGDVVVFESPTVKWIAHRVVRNTDGVLLTRGDSVTHYDPPVPYADVIGEVVSTSVLGIRFGLKWWLPRFYGLTLLACHPVSTYVNHAGAWCVVKFLNLIKKIKGNNNNKNISK